MIFDHGGSTFGRIPNIHKLHAASEDAGYAYHREKEKKTYFPKASQRWRTGSFGHPWAVTLDWLTKADHSSIIHLSLSLDWSFSQFCELEVTGGFELPALPLQITVKFSTLIHVGSIYKWQRGDLVSGQSVYKLRYFFPLTRYWWRRTEKLFSIVE